MPDTTVRSIVFLLYRMKVLSIRFGLFRTRKIECCSPRKVPLRCHLGGTDDILSKATLQDPLRNSLLET